MISGIAKLGIILFIVLPSVRGFILESNHNPRIRSSHINIFGNAFANDDSLGKPINPGLKKGPNVSDVTINGKPVKAVVGQKVSQVLAAARIKVTYSCRKGDCGTCELFMNGRIEKACVAKIPQGKCSIQTT